MVCGGDNGDEDDFLRPWFMQNAERLRAEYEEEEEKKKQGPVNQLSSSGVVNQAGVVTQLNIQELKGGTINFGLASPDGK